MQNTYYPRLSYMVIKGGISTGPNDSRIYVTSIYMRCKRRPFSCYLGMQYRAHHDAATQTLGFIHRCSLQRGMTSNGMWQLLCSYEAGDLSTSYERHMTLMSRPAVMNKVVYPSTMLSTSKPIRKVPYSLTHERGI